MTDTQLKEPIIIKTPEQIEGIRKACCLAARTLDFITYHIKPGVTTEHLDTLIEDFTRQHNAIPAPLNYKGLHNSPPYPKSTCISLNEVICHGIPNERVLQEGDILNIDVTPILDGYYGDTSRMFAVGNISEEAQYLLDASKECMNIGIRQIKPGVRFGNIGWHIYRYAALKGCSVVFQFCGHGVGLAFHEPPQVAHVSKANTGPIMQENMIFTVEPMINLGKPEAIIDEQDKWTARTVDGKLSAQWEHTILVTEDGHEILTIAGL